jgi:hypothetical protein
MVTAQGKSSIGEIIANAHTLEVIENTYHKNGKPKKTFKTYTIYIGTKIQIVIPACMTWQQACELYPRLSQIEVGIMPPFSFHFDRYVIGESDKTAKIYYSY